MASGNRLEEPVPGGDWFPVSEWPEDMQKIWDNATHPDNPNRFKLWVFFCVNGVEPLTAAACVYKRWKHQFDESARRHLLYLGRNHTNLSKEPYGYDMAYGVQRYLYGREKDSFDG